MGKYANPVVMDAALNRVATANLMVAMDGQPASYAAAQAGKLVESAMVGGDFTLAAGDVSGRKVTIAAKSSLAVLTAGTGNHVALLDTATSTLLYVTTCPDQALASGGTVSIAAWAVEIGNPV